MFLMESSVEESTIFYDLQNIVVSKYICTMSCSKDRIHDIPVHAF